MAYTTIALTGMTCPETPVSAVVDGTAVAIAPGSTYAYFHLPGLPALDRTKTYQFQADYDNGTPGAYLAAYSQQSTDVSGYNNSYWWDLANPDLPLASGTVTFQMGPGLADWDNTVGLIPPELFVLFELHKARLTGLRYKEHVTNITTPVRLSVNDPDNGIGDVEGDICVLDSGLVVVARMSSYSYAITLRAIDPATTPPTLGPEKYANLDQYWQGVSGYEVFAGSVDPGGQPWNDLGLLSPMGGNTFCQSGGASDTLNAAGTVWTSGPEYFSAASVYTVNPSSLEISLVKHAVGEYDPTPPFDPDVSWYADETTMARWGDKAIVLPVQYTPDRYQMAVVSPDGSCAIIKVFTASTNASRPGPVMCSGDVGVLLTEHYLSGLASDSSLVSFNPASGAFISTIPCPIDSAWQWSVHAVTMPDGLIAMVTPGPGAIPFGSTGPVWVMIIDPSPLAIVKHFVVTPSHARMTGWTGGWYSNVRSIDAYPDGTLLVSVVDATTRRMLVFQVDPATEVVTVRDAPPFQWFNTQNFISQAVALGTAGLAAIWVASRPSEYGVYYSQLFALPTSITAGSPSTRRHFFEGRH